MSPPTVAIVGRPNVGKSTLVNRIIGRREAIVEEKPGVTRDRKVVEGEWAGRQFSVVDTGGWLRSEDSLARQVTLQAERAMADADLIVMVVDATVGPTEEDAAVAGVLQRSAKPVLLAVNKVDDVSREIDAWDFTRLGLGDPVPISALHGRRSGELLDAIVDALPEEADAGPDGDGAASSPAETEV
ncbi:MAG: GTPase, partial [Acidimicrobiia bacterium]